MGACSSYCMGTNGRVPRICQPWELAANRGSPWMSQAPNLHFIDAVVNSYIHAQKLNKGFLPQLSENKYTCKREGQFKLDLESI